MFRTYYFSEMPYPYAPSEEFASVIRNTMPNRWFDPDAAHELYHKYFDLVRAADELGLDVMFNEHHETFSNLNAAMPLTMAIAARETKRARILALGNPVANRPDPVRVATEMAMVDVVSEGRLDCGFIRGVPTELSATNATPLDMSARMYEAIDLIVKAWTSHDGPFSWEGEFFHHRQVTIVPRPFQQPRPPIWITTVSPSSIPTIAERGYTIATIFNGKKGCREIFSAYQQHLEATGRPRAHPDKFAYCNFVCVCESDEEALAMAPKLQDFLVQSGRKLAGTDDVPGYVPAQARARAQRAAAEGTSVMAATTPDAKAARSGDPVALAESGIAFWGSPESVFAQMREFFYAVGGFGNLLAMFQASTMSYSLTRRSMELYAREVLPRFREEVYEPWLADHGLKKTIGVSETESSIDISRAAGFVSAAPAGS